MSKTLVYHPQKDENGRPVVIENPTISTPSGAWLEHDAIATLSLTDAGRLPEAVNGIPFTDVPCPETTDAWLQWNLRLKVKEPPYPQDPERRTTSGCVVIEPDDRVWIVHPSNRFAQAVTTFPKGRWEPGLSLVVNAVKETLEESGLWVEPTGYLCDVVRTKSITRYYTARRLGGSPRNAGWESQAVSLAPPSALATLLNRENDRKVLPPLFRLLIDERTLPI